MGFITRLLGRHEGRWSTPALDRLAGAQGEGRFAPLPEDNFMKVVGESHCQDALHALASRCAPGADGRPSFLAVLIPEPENAFDRNAIAVHGPTGRVGYLAREDAVRYGATFSALSGTGHEGGSCGALLNGGDRDPPNYGVVLTLAYPDVCERHLGIVQGPSWSGESRHAATKSSWGMLRGKHFTSYAEEVKTLRRHGHDDSAEKLLMELVDVVEAEASHEGWGVAPWYYEQLAIVYRQRRDALAEVAILERFAAAAHAPGVGPKRLLERLDKARQLARRGDAAC